MQPKTRNIVVRTLLVVIVIVLVILLNRLAIGSDAVKDIAGRFGYAGIFLVSVVSGFNVVLPIPVAGFFPFFISAGFHPVVTIAVISLGMVVGDSVGYFLGRMGRTSAPQQMTRWAARVEHLWERHPFFAYLALFAYAAFVPLPNELIVVPFAFLGAKFRYVLLSVFLGNILFNTLVAFGFFHAGRPVRFLSATYDSQSCNMVLSAPAGTRGIFAFHASHY